MATTKPKASKASKAVEEVEEVEETETEAPAFGVADIVALAKSKLKIETSTRELRTLLRKMARDGRLDREIIAGNRTRWEWAGPNDPEVKAVLKALKEGELEADKKEKLEALKQRKAEQRAAAQAEAAKAEKAATKPKKSTKKTEVVEEVEDEDEDLEDDSED